MRNREYHTVRTVPKSNQKVKETKEIILNETSGTCNS